MNPLVPTGPEGLLMALGCLVIVAALGAVVRWALRGILPNRSPETPRAQERSKTSNKR